jgi:hypothetical protein
MARASIFMDYLPERRRKSINQFDPHKRKHQPRLPFFALARTTLGSAGRGLKLVIIASLARSQRSPISEAATENHAVNGPLVCPRGRRAGNTGPGQPQERKRPPRPRPKAPRPHTGAELPRGLGATYEMQRQVNGDQHSDFDSEHDKGDHQQYRQHGEQGSQRLEYRLEPNPNPDKPQHRKYAGRKKQYRQKDQLAHASILTQRGNRPLGQTRAPQKSLTPSSRRVRGAGYSQKVAQTSAAGVVRQCCFAANSFLRWAVIQVVAALLAFSASAFPGSRI